jgi:hypothetical protein
VSWISFFFFFGSSFIYGDLSLLFTPLFCHFSGFASLLSFSPGTISSVPGSDNLVIQLSVSMLSNLPPNSSQLTAFIIIIIITIIITQTVRSHMIPIVHYLSGPFAMLYIAVLTARHAILCFYILLLDCLVPSQYCIIHPPFCISLLFVLVRNYYTFLLCINECYRVISL